MQKKLILIGGLPCAGKTAVGILLSESFDNSACRAGHAQNAVKRACLLRLYCPW